MEREENNIGEQTDFRAKSPEYPTNSAASQATRAVNSLSHWILHWVLRKRLGNFLQIRKEVEEIFSQVDALLKDMSNVCKFQKNVKNTVKNRISGLVKWKWRISAKMKPCLVLFPATNSVEETRTCLQLASQGRLLKAASASSKRERSPSVSSSDEPKSVKNS